MTENQTEKAIKAERILTDLYFDMLENGASINELRKLETIREKIYRLIIGGAK